MRRSRKHTADSRHAETETESLRLNAARTAERPARLCCAQMHPDVSQMGSRLTSAQCGNQLRARVYGLLALDRAVVLTSVLSPPSSALLLLLARRLQLQTATRAFTPLLRPTPRSSQLLSGMADSAASVRRSTKRLRAPAESQSLAASSHGLDLRVERRRKRGSAATSERQSDSERDEDEDEDAGNDSDDGALPVRRSLEEESETKEEKEADDDSVPPALFPATAAASLSAASSLDASYIRIPVPAHRYTPLKAQWQALYQPVVEHMKLQIRFNPKKRCIELRVRRTAAQHTEHTGTHRAVSAMLQTFHAKTEHATHTVAARRDTYETERPQHTTRRRHVARCSRDTLPTSRRQRRH